MIPGISRTVTQAPSTNLATGTISTVAAVAGLRGRSPACWTGLVGPLSLPMHHHAGLREREGHKSADGVQRNQPVRHASEQEEQKPAEYRQHVNPLRVDQSPSSRHERRRQIAILCDGPAEAWKVGKGGVRGER